MPLRGHHAPAHLALRPVVEAMEPRILHSADLLPGLGPLAAVVEHRTEQASPATTQAQGATELVLLDLALPDSTGLLADLQAQQAAGRRLHIVTFSATDDGLAVLNHALAGRSGLAAVHLVSHGADGMLALGQATLDAGTLLARAGEVAGWAAALAPGADLLLYGCDLAAGEAGRALLHDLAALTGADVAASADRTGAATAGGNWVLEQHTGAVQATLAFSAQAQAQWQGSLALLAYNGFAKTGNLNGEDTGFGWANLFTGSGSDLTVVATGLAPAGLAATGGAVQSKLSSFGDTTSAQRDLAAPVGADGSTTWLGFVVQPDKVRVGDYIGLEFGGTDRGFAGYNTTGIILGEAGQPGALKVAGISAASGVPSLLVLKIDSRAGADTATLYVNPTPGLAAPDSGLVQTLNTLDFGSFTRLAVAAGTLSGTNAARFDELRVGTSFVDVAPAALATAPAITSAATANVAEGSTAVATLSAHDANADTVAWRISGGADAALFTLDAATGALAFRDAPDFETPLDADGDNVYQLTVQASDGTLASDQAFTINVTDRAGAVFVVNSTADNINGGDGLTTLREAILAANAANTAVDEAWIRFDLPGTGVQTIRLDSALPSLGSRVLLDGWSDPEYTTNPVVVLNGANATSGSATDGLTLGGNGSTVRGLVIQDFTGAGIVVTGDHNTLHGNRIGTDAAGNAMVANEGNGITVTAGATGTHIGGSGAGQGNLVSGNRANGISIGGSATGTVVQGNRIGINLAGDSARPNSNHGIVVAASGNLIGGTAAGQGNLVAGNLGDGIRISSGSANAVLGNALSSNTGPEVSLAGSVPANDPQDTDTGPNNQQNRPVLGSASVAGGATTVIGVLDSAPATTYRVEFFSSRFLGLANDTQASVLLGAVTVTTDATGHADLLARLDGVAVTAGHYVTATATVDLGGGAFGDTSALATAVRATAGSAAPMITSDAGAGTLVLDMAENGTAVTTLRAIDADGPALTWALTGGADQALFTLDAATGALAFKAAPDHEAPADAGADNQYDLVVAASDGSGTDTLNLSVRVTNLAEPPQALADSYTVNAGTTTALAVLANDLAGDTGTLRLLDVALPAQGSATFSATEINYTAPGEFAGTTGFDYRVGGSNDGLLRYLPLDGVRADTAGGNALAVAGTPSTAAGAFGNAYQFDGRNDAVWMADQAYGSAFTLSFWFKLDSLSGSQFRYVYSHDDADGNNSLNIYFIESNNPDSVADNSLRTRLLDQNGSGGFAALDFNATDLADNQWHQYTLSARQGEGAWVYVDGVERAKSTAVFKQSLNPVGDIYLGGNNVLNSERFFKGGLDSLALYNRAMSPAEVAALHGSGGAGAAATVTVNVLGSGAPPAITSHGGAASVALSIDENTTAVTTVQATDPEGAAVSYRLDSGSADAALFKVDAATGALSFLAEPDFENPLDNNRDGTYQVRVLASDGNGSSGQAFNITLRDIAGALVVDTTADTDPDMAKGGGDTRSVEHLLANKGSDGKISLREAVSAANNTAGLQTIMLGAGTYTLTRVGFDDSNASGDLDIRDNLALVGAGIGQTVLSGGGAVGLLHVISGQASVSQLTLRDGASFVSGGAIGVDAGASLTLEQVVVSNSRSFLGNGGAIVNAGTLKLAGVELRDNAAGGSGGAIHQSGGQLTLDGVTLAHNSAGSGGGLYLAGGSATIVNTTFSGNNATGGSGGGGGAVLMGSAALLNVTVAYNNTSAGVGGGLLTGSAAVSLRNVLLAHNGAAPNLSAGTATVSLGHNLSTDATPLFSAAGDRVNAKASLDTLAANGGPTRTHALLADSEAIDNGDTAAAPAADQRGQARLGNADIGAYELATPVNRAPVNRLPAALTLVEDTYAPVNGLSVADPNDGGANPAWQLAEVALAVDHGRLQLSLAGATVLASGATNSAALVLRGSQADLNATLATLGYQPTANFHGADTLRITSTDDAGLSASNTLALTVQPDNDAPVAGVVPAQRVLEDQGFELLTAGLFSDVEDGTTLTLALAAGPAWLSFDAVGGRLHGTPADGQQGTSTVTLRATDSAGARAELSFTLEAVAVNDAPQGRDGRVAVAEDTPHVFALADFGFHDPADRAGHALLAVRLSSVPATGVLQLAGVALQAGVEVRAQDIAAGLLNWTPPAQAHGSALATLGFQVRDSGGTADGGQDLDPTARVLQLDVAAVNDAPAGVPQITGLAVQQQTLVADTSGITDTDGLGSLRYQWLRNGSAISGATSSAYTLGDADVGSLVQVVVAYTDGDGSRESLTSATLGPVANVDDAPVGAPVIAGTPTEDQTLRADTSAITDADGLGAFRYQWLRNGSAITGATGAAYTLGEADVGASVQVVVAYTDGGGHNESLTSAALGPVANVNDAPVGAPVVTGTPTENQTLRADTSTITDADGLGAFGYQWLRNGSAITGATASAYTLGDADVGASVQVVVAYTDGGGHNESLTSAALGPVASVNDVPVGAPVVTGTPTENQTLRADTRFIIDADGLGSLRYQWLRNGSAITGATGAAYTVGDADVGATVQVVVAYTDGGGHNESLTSAALGPVASVNDLPVGAPVITGTPTEDQTLRADTSTITDADGLGTLRYQWLRNGNAISGATASAYTLGDADVGASVQVVVAYTDGGGHHESLTSAALGPVANVNDAPVGAPLIAGTPEEDQTLRADTSTITDADGLGTLRYQWLRNGSAIAGATASAYTLGDADVGASVQVVVAYTDGGGHNESLASATLGPVANVNDVPVGAPLITGTPAENQTLRADNRFITDADGLGAFRYQWLRNGSAINGATGSAYTLGLADVGAQLQVVVAYTDAGGQAESLSSATLGPVAPLNRAPSGTNQVLTLREDTAYVFSAADFGFSDAADPTPHALAAVQFEQLPAVGELQLNGRTLSPGASVSAADLASGALRYTPPANANGVALASLQFRLRDDGGTLHGGQDTALAPNTLRLDVAAVDDAPQVLANTLVPAGGQQLGLVLVVADPDTTPQDIVISVAGSSGGQFMLGGEPVGQFTLADVQAGLVHFDANGTVAMPGWALSLSDGTTATALPEAHVMLPAALPTPAPAATAQPSEPVVVATPVAPAPLPAAAPAPALAKAPAVVAAAAEPAALLMPALAVETSVPRTAAGPELRTEVDLSLPATAAGPALRDLIVGGPGELELASLQAVPFARLVGGSSLPAEDVRAFISRLDDLRQGVFNSLDGRVGDVAGGTAMSLGLSVGYVVWLVRGGILASSMLAALPSWQLLDPLPMLGRLGGRDKDDGADDEVENLFARRASGLPEPQGDAADKKKEKGRP